jgi:O-antigen/teichoic acid export membrane protein
MSTDPPGPAGPREENTPVVGSDSTTLARGLGVLIPGRFVGRAAGYGVQLLLARLLGPAGYGQFGIGWKILLIGGVLATLGLDNGVVRFGAPLLGRQNDSLRALVRHTLLLGLLVGAIGAAALWMASPWLAESVYASTELQPILAVFALGLVFIPVLRIGAAATRVWQNMSYTVLSEDIVQPISQLALILLLHWLGLGVLGAAGATVLSFVLAAALVVHYLRQLSPNLFGRSNAAAISLRELIGFSLPTSLAGTLALAAMWVDLLLVGYFRSQVETGIYMAASQIAFLFAVVLMSFNAVFAPMIADLYHRGEQERLQELFRTSTRWGLLLSTPLFLVILVDPAGLLAFFMGSQYADGGLPMLILAAGQMINLATGAVGFLVIMSGRPAWWLIATGSALAVNIALNLVLIPRLGLEGAALATTFSLALLFGSALILVRRALRLWPYDRSYLRLIVAGGMATVAAMVPGRLGVGDGNLGTLLEMAIAAVVFWVAAGYRSRETSLLGLLDALRGRG